MIAIFAAILAAACSGSPVRSDRVLASPGKAEIELPTEAVVDGGIFFATIDGETTPLKDVTGLFQGHVIDFFPDGAVDAAGAARKYSAIVGVEYGTPAGGVELTVTAKSGTELIERHASITVKPGVYPSEKLSVPHRTIVPSASDRKKIKRDSIVLAHAYATKTLKQYWDPPVRMPVDGGVTSAFGSFRVYNGEKQSPHFGMDLRAPIGTPVSAPITGRVAVARFLFYTGNTVIIDHGYGLFTIYGHMSKLKVKENEIVHKGQILGLSGMTGRASGPHLHWGINLHGVKVDPLGLIQAFKRQG